MKLKPDMLAMGKMYKVRGQCLVHGRRNCEHVGILTYIGSTTFAFDSDERRIPKHQFNYNTCSLLELVSVSNKQMLFRLDKEY